MDEPSEQPAQNPFVEREVSYEEANDVDESTVQPTAQVLVKSEAQVKVAGEIEFWC